MTSRFKRQAFWEMWVLFIYFDVDHFKVFIELATAVLLFFCFFGTKACGI